MPGPLRVHVPRARWRDNGHGDPFPGHRSLVKACHQRGMEVILDVVFNHTAEGSERGLTLSFRWDGSCLSLL